MTRLLIEQCDIDIVTEQAKMFTISMISKIYDANLQEYRALNKREYIYDFMIR